LFDIKARNKCFLAKQLWNIHLKTDSIWIQWIHHYYILSVSIWDAFSLWTSSPIWKSIISLKDQLVADCGGQHQAIALMTTWSSGELPFTAQSYDFLRFKCDLVPWAKVVWETWSLPGYNFILWLAVKGKLRTRDRLRFLDIDPLCVFYRLNEETHNHLFSAILGLLYFGGWQNHGFVCTGACQPLIVQFVAFFLAETILLVECVKFPLVFWSTWFGKRRTRGYLIIIALLYLLFFPDSRFSSTWFCIFMNRYLSGWLLFCLLGLPVFFRCWWWLFLDGVAVLVRCCPSFDYGCLWCLICWLA